MKLHGYAAPAHGEPEELLGWDTMLSLFTKHALEQLDQSTDGYCVSACERDAGLEPTPTIHKY
jgi:hypothetical protein